MKDGGSNIVFGCFEIKIGMNAAKFTNVGIAGFRQTRHLIGERQVLIKDKTEIAGGVGNFVSIRRVMELG